MEPRYDCTREQMIEKAKAEINPSYSPENQAWWIAAALCAWEYAHGNGWDWNKIAAEAERIVGDG
jgi:hypothetical protein